MILGSAASLLVSLRPSDAGGAGAGVEELKGHMLERVGECGGWWVVGAGGCLYMRVCELCENAS